MLIYVVDDHEMMRDATVGVIRRLAGKARLLDFSNFEAFLRAVATKGVPDLLVLDLKLPGISGCDGVRRARQHCPTAKLAVYSATPASEREQDCIQAGADVYIAKGNTATSFISAIQRLLA